MWWRLLIVRLHVGGVPTRKCGAVAEGFAHIEQNGLRAYSLARSRPKRFKGARTGDESKSMSTCKHGVLSRGDDALNHTRGYSVGDSNRPGPPHRRSTLARPKTCILRGALTQLKLPNEHALGITTQITESDAS